jgi:hypothetical protein
LSERLYDLVATIDHAAAQAIRLDFIHGYFSSNIAS